VKIEELKTRVWRGRDSGPVAPGITTGFAALDDYLPGRGWPIGAITEIFVDRYGLGELTLLIPALVSLTRPDATQEQKWVVWVSPPLIPYAPALRQQGVSIEHLLMIQPSGIRDRLWAVEQVLRSGTSSAVIAWITSASNVALRRLQLAAEEQGCWAVLFRSIDAIGERSPAALRLSLRREAGAVFVQIFKCRGSRPGIVDITGDFPALDPAVS
jgi:hypothetical protein